MPSPPARWSVWIFTLVLLLELACSGLPVPGAAPERDDPVAFAPPAAPQPGEEGNATEAPAPNTPESLFVDLDAEEAPPYERGAVSCPKPTMTIRHPKGTILSVYCATGSGVRSGPYTEWQRNNLLVAATNVDGKLDGSWTRWAKGTDDIPQKIEQQFYIAGVANGDYAQWNADGQLLVRGKMVEGKRDGRFIDRKIKNGLLLPGGACYEAGKELWRTTDENELMKKACGTDAVAEG